MSYIEDFNDYGFVVVRNAFSKELMNYITLLTLWQEKENPMPNGDGQVASAHAGSRTPFTDSLLIMAKDIISSAIGLEIIPTYAYYRVYRSNNVLAIHKDIDSCEISASLCLGYNYPDGYEGWPLYVDGQKIILNPGDMAIYLGCDLYHHRDRFDVSDPNNFLSQIFLHYVLKDGVRIDYAYDKRKDFKEMTHYLDSQFSLNNDNF